MIPPLELDENLPEFEIGNYKNIYNDENEDKEESMENEKN